MIEQFSPSKHNELEGGYILPAETDPLALEHVENYFSERLLSRELNCGFFCAKIQLSEQGLVLLGFKMNCVNYFTPDLISYAAGIDYYNNIFKLFSDQPFSFYRVKKLNAGIVFFYKNSMERKDFKFFL